MGDCLIELNKIEEAYANYQVCVSLIEIHGKDQLPLGDCYLKMAKVNVSNNFKSGEASKNFAGAYSVFLEICDDSVTDALRFYPMELIIEVFGLSPNSFGSAIEGLQTREKDIKEGYKANKESIDLINGKIKWLKEKKNSNTQSIDKLFGWM